MKENVILIGFAATGKTSVGRRLAEGLGREFIDTDQRVEEMAGKPIPEIIAEDGSEAFEELERQALEEVCARQGVVIAAGGGAIMLDENRDLMVESGHVVCLEAKPRTICERLRRAQAEGTSSVADALLKGDDPVWRISMFKDIRQRYYAIADWTVHTDRLTIDQAVDEVVHGLKYLVMSRLERDFYRRSTLTVARELLGQRLLRIIDDQRLSGFIVEVEAYIGEDDAACHAACGRTPRNEAMYGPPGHAYVYFVYGMHHCLNAVTGEEGFPAAVLIRAIEPLEGLEIMRRQRPGRPDRELTNGPAKLCHALAIDRSFNGIDLCTGEVLFIEEGRRLAPEEIGTSPRIGIKADELTMSVPWRFYIQGNDFVSR